VGAFFSNFQFYNMTIPDKPAATWSQRTSAWSIVPMPEYRATVRVFTMFPLYFHGVAFRSLDIVSTGVLDLLLVDTGVVVLTTTNRSLARVLL
jgi:hypothetical protein